MTDNQKAQIIKMRAAGNGYGSIAQSLGISLNTVKSFCRRKAITEKTAVLLTGETTCCENCGREIHQMAKRKRKRFCCDKCCNQWWNSHLDQVKRKAVYDYKCPHCGKEIEEFGEGLWCALVDYMTVSKKITVTFRDGMKIKV